MLDVHRFPFVASGGPARILPDGADTHLAAARSASPDPALRSATMCVAVSSWGGSVAADVVNAYTLIVGDEDGPATVSVHARAEEAWRALDAEVRQRCRLRRRPRRAVDPDLITRLAVAWRAGDPERRFWQILSHRLPVRVPVSERPVLVRR